MRDVGKGGRPGCLSVQPVPFLWAPRAAVPRPRGGKRGNRGGSALLSYPSG